MSIDHKTWRKYERQIHQELITVFTDCEFEFNDSIFGKHSKTGRQIDISVRGNIGGNKILGIIDCKHFSTNIDVKIIESFLVMIEDTKANFGLIINNKGYNLVAKNRANLRNLRLDIIEFDGLEKIQLTYDYLVNQNIKNLELSKYEYFKRAKENS
ncbi:restriction endonuclease [Pseudotamlana agarivorans]|uniref:restriction endonuclease n=1 Tax=Pseudotamlana agarivorans TaxID=481183 RepID=UPI0008305C86|nr:restriction endonuclease [Tamlana agarivorans]